MSGQQYNTSSSVTNPTLISSSTTYSQNTLPLDQKVLQSQTAPLPTQAALPEDTKQTKHGMGGKISGALHKLTGVLHHEKSTGNSATSTTAGVSEGATTIDNSPLYTTSLLSNTLPSALPASTTSVRPGPTVVQAVVPPPVVVEPLSATLPASSTTSSSYSSSSSSATTRPASSSTYSSTLPAASSSTFNSSSSSTYSSTLPASSAILPAAPASYIEQSTFVGPTEVSIQNDGLGASRTSASTRGTVVSATSSSVTQVKDTPIITTERRILPEHQIPVQSEKVIPAQAIQVQSTQIIPEKHIPVTEIKVIPEQRIPVTETKIIPEKHIPVTEMKTVPEQRIPLGSKKEIQETATTTTTEKRVLETAPRVVSATTGTTLSTFETSSTQRSSNLLDSNLKPRIEESTFVGPTKVSVSSSATPGFSSSTTDQSFNKSLRQ